MKYFVTLPVAGQVSFVIEAADADSAIKEALTKTIESGDLEIDSMEKLLDGNACNAPCFEAEAVEDDNEEEEENEL